MNRAKILDALKAAGHDAFASEVTALVQPAVFIRGQKLARRPLWFADSEEEPEIDEDLPEQE